MKKGQYLFIYSYLTTKYYPKHYRFGSVVCFGSTSNSSLRDYSSNKDILSND